MNINEMPIRSNFLRKGPLKTKVIKSKKDYSRKNKSWKKGE